MRRCFFNLGPGFGEKTSLCLHDSPVGPFVESNKAERGDFAGEDRAPGQKKGYACIGGSGFVVKELLDTGVEPVEFSFVASGFDNTNDIINCTGALVPLAFLH